MARGSEGVAGQECLGGDADIMTSCLSVGAANEEREEERPAAAGVGVPGAAPVSPGLMVARTVIRTSTSTSTSTSTRTRTRTSTDPRAGR
jgi:hypothetical protein